MTYSSVSSALMSLFSMNPSLTSVKRGDQFRLGLKGSVTPTPDLTPLVLINRTFRERGVEKGVALSGTRHRWSPHVIDVWDYLADPVDDADTFQNLVESLQQLVRQHRQLDGTADTATTSVLQIRVVGDMPSPRPLGVNNGRSLMHTTFRIEAWEEVRS